MKSLMRGAAEYCRSLARDLRRGWDRFWFTPADPINLAMIRIITGVVLLYTHLTTLPDLLDFIGPHAWLDQQGMLELRRLPLDPGDPSAGLLRSGDQSLWYYVHQPALIWTLQGAFLAAVLCFTLGIFSRAAAVFVWIGHISYIQRGTVMIYGMDSILAMLTFYLLFGPSGAALSLDRIFRRLRQPRALAPPPSVAANVVLRLIQVHMCMIYFASGVAKLQGDTWWNGTAMYYALMVPEVVSFDLDWIGRHDWIAIALSHAGSVFTLFTEIGFPILVWRNRWRPLMLVCVITFQFWIGLLMGLGSFQAAMFAGTLAFVAPGTLRRVLALFSRHRASAPGPYSC